MKQSSQHRAMSEWRRPLIQSDLRRASSASQLRTELILGFDRLKISSIRAYGLHAVTAQPFREAAQSQRMMKNEQLDAGQERHV